MKTVVAKIEGKLVITYEITNKQLSILKFAMENDYSNEEDARSLIDLGLLEANKKSVLFPTDIGKKALRIMRLIGIGDLFMLKGSSWEIPIKAVVVDKDRVYGSKRKGAPFFLQRRLRIATAEEAEKYHERVKSK